MLCSIKHKAFLAHLVDAPMFILFFLKVLLHAKVKSGLHIVITIAEHACDHVLKNVSKLSTYRFQIFLAIITLNEDQGICG